MFLLVSGRHVGAHLDGHKHGVSIEISINFGKKFPRISCIRKIAVTWILARVFAYLPSFFSLILDFIYWMVLIFISIYFEWRDTENQQFSLLDNFFLSGMSVDQPHSIFSWFQWLRFFMKLVLQFCCKTTSCMKLPKISMCQNVLIVASAVESKI